MAAPAPAHAHPGADPAKRQFVIAFAMIIGMVAVLVTLYTVFSPESKDPGVTKQEQVDASRTEAPHIIPTPGSGRAPQSPGDPGGWQQLALFGVLVAGMGTVGGLAWRSSRRAKRRLALDQITP